VSAWIRLYELGLRALPRGLRGDREMMTLTLSDQLAGAHHARERASILARAFLRLPFVIAAEWIDALRDRGSRGAAGGRFYGDGPRGVVMQNMRFTARTLRKNPTFAAVSILLIGLGVGAVTAVFTIVDQVLLRPLPYPEQERLAFLTNGSHNGPTLRGLDDVDALDLWVAARNDQVNLTRTDAEPLRLGSVDLTPSFFPMFGARPALGRVLVAGDLMGHSVAVLTHAAWVTIWGADPGIVGSTIHLNGEAVSLVGVLEPDFVIPEQLVNKDVQVLRPMNWDDPRLQNSDYFAHRVAARLGEGEDVATAQVQLDRLAQELFAQDLLATREAVTWPLVPLKEVTVDDARGGLVLLLGSVALLLLVACANVALLFMARGVSRVREMSIRRALGAGTRVLLSQLVTESLVVGMLGGVLGLGLAYVSLSGFSRWIGDLPRGEAVTLDARVLAFTIALSAATALVFGLMPALRSLGEGVNDRLRESGRSSTEGRGVRWARGGLIVGEVGVSLVLVTLAGLLLRSFLAATSRDPGLDPAGVWVVATNVTGESGAIAPDIYNERMGRVVEALESLPSVTSATYGLEMPFEWVGGNTCCWSQRTAPVGADVRADGALTYLHPVSDAFFETLGTRLVAGRSWSPEDGRLVETPVVLSESLAIQHFGSAANAVGRELQFRTGVARVVGVAESTAHYGLDQERPHGMYLPAEALPFGGEAVTFAIKTRNAGSEVVSSIREAIWSVEPSLPVPSVDPLQTWIDDSSGLRRLGSMLSTLFGAIALLLAAGGLYGTLVYAAAQRRREIGIRIALGAGGRQIQGEMLGRGLGLAALGLALGIPAALLLGRVLEGFLWNVSERDPVSLVSASLVLLATAGLASWVPARRASRTDPLEALRAE
jgi:putative ABC transport system permease protein